MGIGQDRYLSMRELLKPRVSFEWCSESFLLSEINQTHCSLISHFSVEASIDLIFFKGCIFYCIFPQLLFTNRKLTFSRHVCFDLLTFKAHAIFTQFSRSQNTHQNYNKILESDWLSAGPIRALTGPFTCHACNWTISVICVRYPFPCMHLD